MAIEFACLIVGDETLTLKCAQKLHERGHRVCGVVSDNDELRHWAEEIDVPVLESVAGAVTEKVAPFDYLFSIANLKILPDELILAAREAAVNFHDSLLPGYAGIHATSWALMNGETVHGVSWHLMTGQVDAGQILVQGEIEISDEETALSLNAKCLTAGIETFAELIDALERGVRGGRSQDLSKRSYFGKWMRPQAAGVVSWLGSRSGIQGLVRGLDLGPYGNAIGVAKIAAPSGFFLCGKATGSDEPTGAEGGTVLSVTEDAIRVACSEGSVELRGLSTLFGKRLGVRELNAYGVRTGERLRELSRESRERISRMNAEVCRFERFWLDRLSGLSPVALPQIRPGARTEAGLRTGAVSLETPGHLLDSSSVQYPESTPERFMAVAFVLFAARVTGESRFDVGLEWSQPSETQDMTQLFAEVVPWRVNAGEEPIGKLIESGLKELETTQAHKTFLKDLWARSGDLAGASGPPPFPIEIALREKAASFSEGVVLRFHCSTADSVRLLYPADLVSDDDVRLVAGQFLTFLRYLLENPDRAISEAEIISTDESAWIRDWNSTGGSSCSGGMTVPELFERQVEATPEHTAVICGDTEVTYRGLNERSNQLARYLRRRGVGPDMVVGLTLRRSPELIVALLGIQKAGSAYLPLDPDYPLDRLRFIARDAGVTVLVTEAELTPLLDIPDIEIVSIDRDWARIALEDKSNPSAAARPENLAYVIYTSGSTGQPKGVMVEHRHVGAFFDGMDDRIDYEHGDVWLAVTSISFDISVLELFWTLCRGFRVVLYPDDRAADRDAIKGSRARSDLTYSLFYFSADQGEEPLDKYRLLTEGARFADANGFAAVWTPERHFHDFGGLYPNPSVTSAALAMITENVQLRSGSVVAPLHSPIRIAEEWAVVDNLSRGRVGIAFASGWMPGDFVIRPDQYEQRREATFQQLETVRQLWRGDAVTMADPLGAPTQIRTLPRPIQAELPVWVTTAGNPATYRRAAELGAGVLTHLLGQTLEEVAEKIAVYRDTWTKAGHAGRGHVALMLHTFIGDNEDYVRETVRGPLIEYLRSSTDLLKTYAWAFPAFRNRADAESVEFVNLPADDLEALLEFAFSRYFETSGLFGTPDSCLETVSALAARDVDEIACLVDFGIPTDIVLPHLEYIERLKRSSASGMRPIGAARANPTDIGELIRTHSVSHLQCTPSMARMLIAESDTREALRELKVLAVGGEALPPRLAAELLDVVGGRILNMYGPTETTIWSGSYQLEEQCDPVPVGRPILNTTFHVVNASGRLQGVGVPGELWIGGAGVTRGYLGRADLTAQRFVEEASISPGNGRLYRTGDLVRYLRDGNLEFLGRIDHQVKVRGHRIELGEIETALAGYPPVSEAVVTARQDEDDTYRLYAYVTARDGVSCNESELRAHLRRYLPEYMSPSRIVVLEALPKTPNGKIDRSALPDPAVVSLRSQRQPPEGPIEIRLAEIWSDVLGTQELDRNDDFFEIGGDSLSLIQVTRRAEEAFSARLSVAAMIEGRTLAHVAEALRGAISGLPNGHPAVDPESEQASLDRVAVRRMKPDDLEQVVAIHLDNFPDWRVTLLGPRFLRKMYVWFIGRHGQLSLVATKGNQVVGYTVGTIGGYKLDLLASTLPEAILGFLRSPLAIVRRSLLNALDSSRPPMESPFEAETSPGDQPLLANNRIMALARAEESGSLELMLAFEAAAQEHGVSAHFHEWSERH